MQLAVVKIPVVDVYKQPLKSSLEHQVLLGEMILVNEEKNNFYKIQTWNEYYPGWIKKSACRLANRHYACKFVRIMEKEVQINSLVIYAGTKLEVIGEEKSNYDIILPDSKSAKISKKAAELPKSWAIEDVILTAHRVSNWQIPYLLGGMTPRGIDCSGLMKLILRMNNIEEFPRDSWQQYGRTCGYHFSNDAPSDAITDYKALLAGDMAFFTTPERNRTTHVAMMLDRHYFVHASKKMSLLTNNAIAISTFVNDKVFGNYYKENFVGARRFWQ